ncbi:hypothetical protein BEL04_14630 [Mucilaginibacter sp. PPCGB 2223]|uniref:PAS domain-containing sensor histidine kinase n=1 Tax=Mucilaginibacter sp. PPCGB 2223 TaxID=1886027 RepID=UPI0008244F3E|nr:PAS domain-containing sensor histidine kinase [Mucilaginibacter sp. PPCGB 2223]OCX52679.1 hypothetical protein BEL04_14630 [Mucilaginibacter sp. PPCGB 2223]
MNYLNFDYGSDNAWLDSGEDAVKKAEANMHAILDNADSGYALYDADLRIVSYNSLAQKFSQLLYSKNLKKGNYLLDYFPPERHPILLDVTRRVLAGEEIQYEMHFDGLPGGERWMDVKWTGVKNGEGNKNRGFILISKDITQRKQLAIEREKMLNELSKNNKVFEQFTHITSHNLNAPVANIITLAETFNELDNQAEKDLYIDFILTSAKSLQQVILDINQVLHIRQHLGEVKENIELKDLLNNIKSIISTDIARERVAIKHYFATTHVFGPRTYMHSIFYNLILNSIKYRRPGVAPQITIAARTIESQVVLTFTDNGKGIDMKRHGDKLFGLYNRFDSQVEGRGLGLFMVKTQVEEMGGTIHVDSIVGQGTTFTVQLPL